MVASEADASTSSTASAQVERETKQTAGPVEVTTTVEEYYPCDPLACPQDVGEVAQLRPDAGPRQGLKRKTVRVEKRLPIGPEGPAVVKETRQEARAEAQGATETHETTKVEQTARVETERTAGPPPWAWALAPVLILAVLAIGGRARYERRSQLGA